MKKSGKSVVNKKASGNNLKSGVIDVRSHHLLCMTCFFDKITSATRICGKPAGIETAPEWRVCGCIDGNASYFKGRELHIGIPGFND